MLLNFKANRLQLLAGQQQVEKCKQDEWLPADAAKQLIAEISCSWQKNETKSLILGSQYLGAETIAVQEEGRRPRRLRTGMAKAEVSMGEDELGGGSERMSWS